MGSALARIGSRRHAPQRRGGRTGSSCTPELDIAANPATIQALMRGADAGTRERLATALQRRYGNAAVQRLVAPTAVPLQRWAVGLPRGTTDCGRIVSYLNTRSPHRRSSGWAKTRVSFGWRGSPAYTVSDGVITATVSSSSVTKTTTVDMPQWSPSDPAVSRAWGSMYDTLRAHEGEHERIAREWEAELTTRLSALSVTVANKRLGTFTRAVRSEWKAWLAEHQADQRAIDPFSALLDCSGGAPEAEAAAAGVEGVVGAAGGG
jgi:predicted secreted Zn-dependent protease